MTINQQKLALVHNINGFHWGDCEAQWYLIYWGFTLFVKGRNNLSRNPLLCESVHGGATLKGNMCECACLCVCESMSKRVDKWCLSFLGRWARERGGSLCRKVILCHNSLMYLQCFIKIAYNTDKEILQTNQRPFFFLFNMSHNVIWWVMHWTFSHSDLKRGTRTWLYSQTGFNQPNHIELDSSLHGTMGK